MCRNFSPGISGGVLTPLTPPLDPPLLWMVLQIIVFYLLGRDWCKCVYH